MAYHPFYYSLLVRKMSQLLPTLTEKGLHEDMNTMRQGGIVAGHMPPLSMSGKRTAATKAFSRTKPHTETNKQTKEKPKNPERYGFQI